MNSNNNFLKQKPYAIKFDWGLDGAKIISSESDVCIIVDVLSFSTCVDVVISKGGSVLPYQFKDETSKDFANKNNAILAETRSKIKPSLSPQSLFSITNGQKIVLPSPNGSNISFNINSKHVLCGCLRNAKAVANAAMSLGKNISVIAAGEKWENGNTRFAIEDLIGAGAILNYLNGNYSPEADIAINAFKNFSKEIYEKISESVSGQELIERGFLEDVEIACALNVSSMVPVLIDKMYSQY